MAMNYSASLTRLEHPDICESLARRESRPLILEACNELLRPFYWVTDPRILSFDLGQECGNVEIADLVGHWPSAPSISQFAGLNYR